MKVLIAGGGSYLTGSDIADAVLRYGLALAKRRELDLVDIPVLVGGAVRRAVFTIGWRCETRAETCVTEGDELVEAGTTSALAGKASAAGAKSAHPLTTEDAAALSWPDTDADPAL
jgi:hypothetical protein